MFSEMLMEFFANIKEHVFWIGLAFALVFIAMVIDLITGIVKANRQGVATTSKGLRRTCSKALKYFLPILSCACIDLMLCSLPIYGIPYFTIFFAAYCMICEGKSVFENTRNKDELKDTAKLISQIIKNKDDQEQLLQLILDNVISDDKIDVTKEKIIDYVK